MNINTLIEIDILTAKYARLLDINSGKALKLALKDMNLSPYRYWEICQEKNESLIWAKADTEKFTG